MYASGPFLDQLNGVFLLGAIIRSVSHMSRHVGARARYRLTGSSAPKCYGYKTPPNYDKNLAELAATTSPQHPSPLLSSTLRPPP